MENQGLYDKIQRLINLHKERAICREFKSMSFDLKEECEKYYNNEIQAILQDPYIYDKWYGMQMGGII